MAVAGRDTQKVLIVPQNHFSGNQPTMVKSIE